LSFLDAVNPHSERHTAGRAGWLRAAVLGANDGLVSTASLMVGVAASSAAIGAVLTAGLAGLAAGSMAMATTAPICCLSIKGLSADTACSPPPVPRG
jgi:vacuolar iron transporter family protein